MSVTANSIARSETYMYRKFSLFQIMLIINILVLAKIISRDARGGTYRAPVLTLGQWCSIKRCYKKMSHIEQNSHISEKASN